VRLEPDLGRRPVQGRPAIAPARRKAHRGCFGIKPMAVTCCGWQSPHQQPANKKPPP
jgi:hypothetical protein